MIKDSTQSDLTVLINNLRIKTEIDPTNQDSFYQKNMSMESYNAEDLIQFDNHKKLGFIIQTSPESLNVLNQDNQLQAVKIHEVNRKVTQGKFTNSIDSDNNVIQRGTLIKIKDRNDPLRG